MKIYAEVPYHRTRQIASDVAVGIWIVVWIRIGIWIHDLVAELAGPGETVENAGSGFAENLASIRDRVGDVPLVGDQLRAPFDAAARAGRTLEQAGAAQQDVIHTLALWLGILLAVIPIGYVLLRQVPKRVRWIREASAASKLRIDAADLHLFALRAVLDAAALRAEAAPVTIPLGLLPSGTTNRWPGSNSARSACTPLPAVDREHIGLCWEGTQRPLRSRRGRTRIAVACASRTRRATAIALTTRMAHAHNRGSIVRCATNCVTGSGSGPEDFGVGWTRALLASCGKGVIG